MKRVKFDIRMRPSERNPHTPSIPWEGYELPFTFPGAPFVVARLPVPSPYGGYVPGPRWGVFYAEHGIHVSKSRGGTRGEAIDYAVAVLAPRTEEQARANIEAALFRANSRWMLFSVTE